MLSQSWCWNPANNKTEFIGKKSERDTINTFLPIEVPGNYGETYPLFAIVNAISILLLIILNNNIVFIGNKTNEIPLTQLHQKRTSLNFRSEIGTLKSCRRVNILIPAVATPLLLFKSVLRLGLLQPTNRTISNGLPVNNYLSFIKSKKCDREVKRFKKIYILVLSLISL